MSDWKVYAAKWCQKMGGKVRPTKHYRCKDCQARRTLARELWQYVLAPRCACGSRFWRPEIYRSACQRDGAQEFATCSCDGLHHPHRAASSVWCKLHPTGPSDSDQRERFG